jgi:hypothetical protein
VVKRGKTPVWSHEDAKKLLESIPRDDLAGLRDRALISTMLFSFARISAGLARFCHSSDKISITRDRGAGYGSMRKAARSMKRRHTIRSRKPSMSTWHESVSTTISRCLRVSIKQAPRYPGAL